MTEPPRRGLASLRSRWTLACTAHLDSRKCPSSIRSLNQYYVVLEAAPQYWQSPEGLNYIYPSANTSGTVPLNAVATAQAGSTPLQVNHTGLFPSVTVSFNMAPGMSLSDATRLVSQMQAAAQHAFDCARLFCRNGSGLPAIAEDGARPGDHGAAGGVHRPWHPV